MKEISSVGFLAVCFSLCVFIFRATESKDIELPNADALCGNTARRDDLHVHNLGMQERLWLGKGRVYRLRNGSVRNQMQRPHMHYPAQGIVLELLFLLFLLLFLVLLFLVSQDVFLQKRSFNSEWNPSTFTSFRADVWIVQ